MDTLLDSTLRNMDELAAYDALCKKVLSEKIVLAWIMKTAVAEFQNCEIAEIAEKYIEGTPQIGDAPVLPDESNSRLPVTGGEDATGTEGTVTYDIRFNALVPGSEDRIRLIINVEAQNDYYPGYPLVKRGLYYCSRLISAQYGSVFQNAQYQKIRKVYSIWVCMNPPKNRQNTITTYSVTEKNLIGSVCENRENYDLLTTVMICLGNPEGDEYRGLLRLLDVLFTQEKDHLEKRRVLEEDFGIPFNSGLHTEVSGMCNLSKGIYEKGEIRGEARGEARGEMRGRILGMLDSIRQLMQSMHWTAEEAMNALQIPMEDREKYLTMLTEA